jgi:hypothetical protein
LKPPAEQQSLPAWLLLVSRQGACVFITLQLDMAAADAGWCCDGTVFAASLHPKLVVAHSSRNQVLLLVALCF